MQNKAAKVMLLIMLLLILSASVVSAQDIQINIYSINDLHGALRPRVDAPGLSVLSGALREMTKNTPNNIIVAAGDLFGTTTDAKDSNGISTVKALNKLGVECIAIGNHEFDYPADILKQQIQAAKFLFMAANAIGSSNNFASHMMLDKKGVKIALIGMITPETKLTAAKANTIGIEFSDPATVLQRYIDQMRSQGAQIVILLSHIGSNQTVDGDIQGEITNVIDNVRGLDAAITAHTHMLVSGNYKSVPVVQAKCYGQAIAQLQITYSTEQNKVLSIVPIVTLVNKDNFHPDVQMGKFIQPYLDAANKKYNRTLAINEQPLTNDRFQTSTIANYFLDLIRKNTQVDIVLLNGGGVRKDYIAPGAFTMANLIDVFPFNNRLISMQISGRNILAALNYGIIHPRYGALRTSGLHIQYDSHLPAGQQILSVTLADGQPLQPDKYYKVAVADFIADGGDGYLMFREYQSREVLEEITDIITRELHNKPRMSYVEDNRVIDINK